MTKKNTPEAMEKVRKLANKLRSGVVIKNGMELDHNVHDLLMGFPQIAQLCESLHKENQELRKALKPATEGGLALRVNVQGTLVPDEVQRVVSAAAGDLEIQKEFVLSSLQHES